MCFEQAARGRVLILQDNEQAYRRRPYYIAIEVSGDQFETLGNHPTLHSLLDNPQFSEMIPHDLVERNSHGKAILAEPGKYALNADAITTYISTMRQTVQLARLISTEEPLSRLPGPSGEFSEYVNKLLEQSPAYQMTRQDLEDLVRLRHRAKSSHSTLFGSDALLPSPSTGTTGSGAESSPKSTRSTGHGRRGRSSAKHTYATRSAANAYQDQPQDTDESGPEQSNALHLSLSTHDDDDDDLDTCRQPWFIGEKRKTASRVTVQTSSTDRAGSDGHTKYRVIPAICTKISPTTTSASTLVDDKLAEHHTSELPGPATSAASTHDTDDDRYVVPIIVRPDTMNELYRLRFAI